MWRISIILLLLLEDANAQVDHDWSFRDMCKFWNGKRYQQRSKGFNSMTGDTCDFQIHVTTDSEESARRYCEDNIPYHINAATPGWPTVCSAEATLICKNGWVQMFGRCYKVYRKMMTRPDAIALCESKKSELDVKKVGIAFMHRETLPFRINDYFTKISAVWMDASEAIARDLIHETVGGYLLLALDGYKYNLPNLSIARVARSDKAMPLCEYTPEMNRAESNYLLKRFGEIYYPTIVTSQGAFVRTSSSLNRNENDPLAENKYCTKMMAPFIPDGRARSAVPTEEFLTEVNKGSSGVIIRTSAFSMNANKDQRMKSSCSSYDGAVHQLLYENLDGDTHRDGTPGLETMSDARYAPIYCQNVVKDFEYGDCPAGFTAYYRKSISQKWCHKFFVDMKFYNDAEEECQKHGAHLTGFMDKDELQLLNDLIGSNYVKNWYYDEQTWLGATRRAECEKLGAEKTIGYSPDPDSPCSRLRVYEWREGVAPNPPNLEHFWDHIVEPNFKGNKEKCLHIIKKNGKTTTVNDTRCDKPFHFICGREAPFVSKS